VLSLSPTYKYSFAARIRTLYAEHLAANVGTDEFSFGFEDFTEILADIGISKHDQSYVFLPEVVRYFFLDQVNYLRQFYEERIILAMEPAHILELQKKLQQAPFELFFYRLTNFSYRILQKEEKNDFEISLMDDNTVDSGDTQVTAEPQENAQNPGDAEVEEAEVEDDDRNMILLDRDNVMEQRYSRAEKTMVYMVFIPELTIDCLDHLAKRTMSELELMCIRIYHTVRRNYFRDSHSFTYKFSLYTELSLDSSKEKDRHIFQEAIEWLSTNYPNKGCGSVLEPEVGMIGVIGEEGRERYYTREAYLSTQAILESFDLLLKRHREGGEERMKDSNDNNVSLADMFFSSSLAGGKVISEDGKILPAKPNITEAVLNDLCCEQMKALYLHADVPIVTVTGRAGSGKSTLLKKIFECYNPGEVMAVAFQGRNVANLAQVLKKFCYTCHNLLSKHEKHCVSTCRALQKLGTSSLADMKQDLGVFYKRCPLESVRVLIFEEVSVMREELFSLVLSAFMRCSKLSKIIVCGDPNQLPPIGPGNVMQEVADYCERIGTRVNFNHIHRTDPRFKKLNNLAQCVLDKNVDGIIPDGRSFIHEECEFKYSGDQENPEVGFKVLDVIKKYKLEEYNHHVITRNNLIKDSINPVLDIHFRGYEPTLENIWVGRNHFRKGAKMIFKKMVYDKDTTLVNNELLKIDDIQDTIEDKELCMSVVSTEAPRSFTKGKRYLVVNSLDNTTQDSRKILWNGANKRYIKKAYATTIHGAIGGEYPTVILVLPNGITDKLIYTAVTRAKKTLILVGTMHHFFQSILTPEPRRNCELGDLLFDRCSPHGMWLDWQPPERVLLLESVDSIEEDVIFQEPKAALDCLPLEMWIEVFSFAIGTPEDLPNVPNLRCTCKDFKRVFLDTYMWKHIYTNIYNSLPYVAMHEAPDAENKIEEHYLEKFIAEYGSTIHKCLDCKFYFTSKYATILDKYDINFSDLTRDSKDKKPPVRFTYRSSGKLCLCKWYSYEYDIDLSRTGENPQRLWVSEIIPHGYIPVSCSIRKRRLIPHLVPKGAQLNSNRGRFNLSVFKKILEELRTTEPKEQPIKKRPVQEAQPEVRMQARPRLAPLRREQTLHNIMVDEDF